MDDAGRAAVGSVWRCATPTRAAAGRTLLATVLATALTGCALGPPLGAGSGAPTATVTLAAAGNVFSPARTSLPAGVVVGVELENRDPGILHNVAIYPADAGEARFRGETFTGIRTTTYVVAPLSAGSYRLVCDVHPSMVVELEVEQAAS